jgi:GMP synthase (glutamine-hydrolysing)
MLVVEHEAQCPPGWMGEWLAAAGCELDVRRPHAGDALPEDLSGHGGLLVLGGSMDAYADAAHPWLTDVKQLVRLAAEQQVPTLGICLGHQLAAVALGGAVHRNPRGQQIGVIDVGWAPAAATDRLFADLVTARVGVQWNNDVVAVVPPGTEVLARAVTGEIQAARFAPTVWGVQSHPEAGKEIVTAWADNDRDDAIERGVDVDAYLAAVAAARTELRAAWRPLATSFASLVGERTPAW